MDYGKRPFYLVEEASTVGRSSTLRGRRDEYYRRETIKERHSPLPPLPEKDYEDSFESFPVRPTRRRPRHHHKYPQPQMQTDVSGDESVRTLPPRRSDRDGRRLTSHDSITRSNHAPPSQPPPSTISSVVAASASPSNPGVQFTENSATLSVVPQFPIVPLDSMPSAVNPATIVNSPPNGFNFATIMIPIPAFGFQPPFAPLPLRFPMFRRRKNPQFSPLPIMFDYPSRVGTLPETSDFKKWRKQQKLLEKLHKKARKYKWLPQPPPGSDIQPIVTSPPNSHISEGSPAPSGNPPANPYIPPPEYYPNESFGFPQTAWPPYMPVPYPPPPPHHFPSYPPPSSYSHNPPHPFWPTPYQHNAPILAIEPPSSNDYYHHSEPTASWDLQSWQPPPLPPPMPPNHSFYHLQPYQALPNESLQQRSSPDSGTSRSNLLVTRHEEYKREVLTDDEVTCYNVCCNSGLSTAIWIILGILLLGLILGLILGLTLV